VERSPRRGDALARQAPLARADARAADLWLLLTQDPRIAADHLHLDRVTHHL
jgi:hypothetical protein